MLNMWYDADIDAVMTPNRDAANPARQGLAVRGACIRARSWRRRSGGSRAGDEHHCGRTAGRHDPLLCRRVHGMAEAVHAPEHRHRWRGRRAAARDRMGRRDRGHRASSRLRLFLIIFLWTPPHFWALALNRTDDYARAGVPMLPVVAGRAATTRQILIYSGLLASGLGAALGARVCRRDLWRDRRDLRGAFPSARVPAEQKRRGRSPRGPSAVRVLHLLLVRAVCGPHDRPWRWLIVIHARRRMAAPRIGTCRTPCQAPFAAHVPSTSAHARSNMRYRLLGRSS